MRLERDVLQAIQTLVGQTNTIEMVGEYAGCRSGRACRIHAKLSRAGGEVGRVIGVLQCGLDLCQGWAEGVGVKSSLRNGAKDRPRS